MLCIIVYHFVPIINVQYIVPNTDAIILLLQVTERKGVTDLSLPSSQNAITQLKVLA